MSSPEASALLARLLQLGVDVAKQNSPAEAAQRLAAALGSLFKCQQVLLFDYRQRLKLIAADNYQGRPPSNAYSSQLLDLASQFHQAQTSAGQTLDECFWLPLGERRALLLQRADGQAWKGPEQTLLQEVAPLLAATLRPPSKSRRRGLWIAAAAVALFMLPVPEWVAAPAVVESDAADRVYAPIEGVIENLLLPPGSWVEKGQPLLRYQQRDWLQQRLQAQREQELAEAELARLRAAAWQDTQSRAAIPAQQLRVQQAQQSRQHLETLLAETEIKAQQDGLLMIDDPERLEGALVRAGELLFTVADPQKLRIKLYTPVADVGKLQPQAKLSFRSHARPFTAWPAEVGRLAMDVQLSESQQPSLPAWAYFEDPKAANELSLGERGTARVTHGWTLLGLSLLLKPWQQLQALLPL